MWITFYLDSANVLCIERVATGMEDSPSMGGEMNACFS